MLICPQCQAENPFSNKFCKNCGTSLTHKVCAECGANVALNQKQCQNCGAVTGKTLLAIVCLQGQSQEANVVISDASPQTLGDGEKDAKARLRSAQALPSHLNNLQELPSLLAGEFLDPQQRYQLLEFLPPATANTELQFKVLDTQPLQMSPLQAGANSVVSMPAVAQIYLTLQSQLPEVLPTIHDAWQAEGVQVILIADRSDWSALIAKWQDTTTPRIQILHWLYEMVQLWIALEPVRCRQSLLELSNLRVDEDGVIALQRLYVESADLTLLDLGQFWYRLFQESQRTQFGAMVALLCDLRDGIIQSTTSLQSRLAEIAQELQPSANVSTTTTSTDPQANTALQMEIEESQVQIESQTLLLPMQLFKLEDAGSTDVGRNRDRNEDFFGIETTISNQELPHQRSIHARGLYILCDGMGGHAGGEVASTLAVKTLQEYFKTHWEAQLPNERTIREAVSLANQVIYDQNQQQARSGVGRMGTTLVMVLLENNQIAVAHVGDSRLYLLTRKRGFEQVTTDHEVGQREILRGIEPEIAYGRPDAYQLTQALGPRESNFVNPDVQFLDISEDTLLILASDGLSDNDLLEHHWHTHVEPLLSSNANLESGVANLIDLANHYNGHDNITAIAIRVKVRPKPEQSA